MTSSSLVRRPQYVRILPGDVFVSTGCKHTSFQMFHCIAQRDDLFKLRERKSRHCESNSALSLPGSTAFLPTPSYVRMRTTFKHHVAGTVKHTVPYKDVCIFFINWGMATEVLTLSLRNIYYTTNIKRELNKKGLIRVLQFRSAYTRAATAPDEFR
uniref:Uncharacterized protein n=1 Tax=Timema cristinae TaxID=61476 RepID=A0A7R9H5Z2_TIMCR|nr:unnamed protein product [Timema cristinae]